jgi:hypothetical protein
MQWVAKVAFSLWVKPRSVDVKYAWKYTFSPPYVPIMWLLINNRDNFFYAGEHIPDLLRIQRIRDHVRYSFPNTSLWKGYDVLWATDINTVVSWRVIMFNLVRRYQRFRWTFRILLQGIGWRKYFLSKFCKYPSNYMALHGRKSQPYFDYKAFSLTIILICLYAYQY